VEKRVPRITTKKRVPEEEILSKRRIKNETGIRRRATVRVHGNNASDENDVVFET
jgi:hypothetical protein